MGPLSLPLDSLPQKWCNYTENDLIVFEKCHISAIFFRHVGMTFLYDDNNFFGAMLCQEILCSPAPLKNFVKLAGLLERPKLHFLATTRPYNPVYLLHFTEVIQISF